MLRIAIFASGNGSNAINLIRHFAESNLARVVMVLTDRPDAGVITKANGEKVPVIVSLYSELVNGSVEEHLEAKKVDLIVLAGFLRKIPDGLLHAFPERILNIHPALLPKHGGKGMFGHHVHNAVLQAGDKESGITIHLVNEDYDKGRILFQARCLVLPGDDAKALQGRVQTLEHLHFPSVVEKYINQLNS